MTRYFLFAPALMLAACQSVSVPEAPTRADLASELVRRAPEDGPPPKPDGACWANDTAPAVIETVTEQVEVSPAVIGPDGTVITPATYRSSTHQRILTDRESVWFRTPCPDELTVDFIATVQRALKARGFYMLPLTGQMDAATGDAIRRFQQPLGMDSAVLSLAAARALGIVAADFGRD
ncbi:peptidoglycan-binding protein [Fertoebacter nigrum]|uniref:Peptidoglycan-binding protein n=1 Tax=Fertoeibacter niger TaxID=2656921 RepID=A0A8X8KNS2_9RHOB|nr:peptidoglycan-binding domain-containing protein [Fertoeibacter niger]NUB44091.1 peptidoglycan-binding protein [Fertoeibacter niger]